MADLEIIAIHDIGEVRPGDDLAELIVAADDAHLQDGDCLVITQKVVSKAEGRLVDIDPTDPLSHKPLVEAESVRILRRRGELIISQTEHGFVCANAGIDLSNVERGQAALLPVDSDRSARGIRDRLRARHGHDVAVIISESGYVLGVVLLEPAARVVVLVVVLVGVEIRVRCALPCASAGVSVPHGRLLTSSSTMVCFSS